MNLTISKTTVTGVLSLLTTVALVLMGSGSPLIGPKAMQWITLSLAVLRALTGYFTKDAETVTSNDVANANAKANNK